MSDETRALEAEIDRLNGVITAQRRQLDEFRDALAGPMRVAKTETGAKAYRGDVTLASTWGPSADGLGHWFLSFATGESVRVSSKDDALIVLRALSSLIPTP